jgi:hypothetical protein
MKTAILTAAMMILMTAAVSARTIETNVNPGSPEKVEFKAMIVQPSTHMINFRVANPSSDKIVMKIYNDKKVKVFHRVTKKNAELSIKCDMNNVESGVYTAVVLRNGQEEIRKQFIILN